METPTLLIPNGRDFSTSEKITRLSTVGLEALCFIPLFVTIVLEVKKSGTSRTLMTIF